MAIYTAYLPPSGDATKLRLIPDRASLLALVAPAVFLLWHRLWFALLMYAMIVAALVLFGRIAGETTAGFLSVLPGFFLFLQGRELVMQRHERAGWREVGVVSAGSAREAEIRYFKDARVDVDELTRTVALAGAASPAASPAAKPASGEAPSGSARGRGARGSLGLFAE